MTVIGLCFGGGQLGLGLIGLVLALVVLWLLKAVEQRVTREHTLSLHVVYIASQFSRQRLFDSLKKHGCKTYPTSAYVRRSDNHAEEWFEVRWNGTADLADVPPLIDSACDAGALEASWTVKR